MAPAFGKAEYDSRLAKVRKAMQDRGLDAMVIGDPANINWLSGYDAWYFLLARYPVSMVLPLLLLLPVSIILGAIGFLGERPDAHVMPGGLIGIGGVGAVIVEPSEIRKLWKPGDG